MNPSNVAPRWRRAAFAIAFTLLAGFVAYAVVTIVTAVKKRDEPPTQSRLVKKEYAMPIFIICPPFELNVTFDETELFCEAELRDPKKPSDPLPAFASSDGFAECGVERSAISDGVDEIGSCLVVNPKRNITLRTRRDRMSVAFGFTFATSSDPNNFEAVVRDLTPRAFELFIVESLGAELDTPELLPFPGLTAVAVQRTEFTFLDKSKNSIDYSTTQINAQPANSNANNASFLETQGNSSFLRVDFLLSSLTVQLVEENDPLDVTVLIGALSGFWGLVGAAWGALFIPAEPERLKPRWDRETGKANDDAKKDATEMASGAAASAIV
jgi:hypothetical protein